MNYENAVLHYFPNAFCIRAKDNKFIIIDEKIIEVRDANLEYYKNLPKFLGSGITKDDAYYNVLSRITY